jgi:hypothetical protein
MKIRELVLVVLIVCSGVSVAAQHLPFDIIFNDKGTMNAHVKSESALIEVFGQTQIKQTDIHLGEGEMAAGTIVFPDDPLRKIEFVWKNSTDRSNPERIIIRGDQSLWKTGHGISLGTSLKQIETINGKPFNLTGFAWDYEGTIVGWNDGTLNDLDGDPESETARSLLLRLRPSKKIVESISETDFRSVSGDSIFKSDHPVMQVLDPVVYEMILFHGEREGEGVPANMH